MKAETVERNDRMSGVKLGITSMLLLSLAGLLVIAAVAFHEARTAYHSGYGAGELRWNEDNPDGANVQHQFWWNSWWWHQGYQRGKERPIR